MHRDHASFGHIADFGGMCLQQPWGLWIFGGLNYNHAGVGNFDLFMDVNNRI